MTTSPKLSRGGYEGRLRGRGLLMRSDGFEGTIGPVMEKRGERFWGNKRAGKMQACCTCGRGVWLERTKHDEEAVWISM